MFLGAYNGVGFIGQQGRLFRLPAQNVSSLGLGRQERVGNRHIYLGSEKKPSTDNFGSLLLYFRHPGGQKLSNR